MLMHIHSFTLGFNSNVLPLFFSLSSTGYSIQYRRLLQCIVVIQKNYRALYWRRRFQTMRWATITLQKRLRGQRARRLYSHLLEEKRKREEEERRRREEQEALERWAVVPVLSYIMKIIIIICLYRCMYHYTYVCVYNVSFYV